MKPSLKIIVIVVSIITGLIALNITGYAQSLFGSAPKTNTSNAAQPITDIPPSRVMTTDSFNQSVSKMGQQNLNALSQQTQETILKRTQPQTPSKTAPIKPASPSTSSDAETDALPSSTPATSGTTTAPAEAQPSGSQQIYTGFGAATPSKQKPQSGTSGSKDNSSWSIKY